VCVGGTCACPPGVHGARCELACPADAHGRPCSGHGVCALSAPLAVTPREGGHPGVPSSTTYTGSGVWARTRLALAAIRGAPSPSAPAPVATAAAAIARTAELPAPIESEDAAAAVLAAATGLPPHAPPPSPPPGSLARPAAAPGPLPTCHCEPGWRGHDCGLRACPRGCNGHGLCLEGRCQCAANRSGVDCSEPAAAPAPTPHVRLNEAVSNIAGAAPGDCELRCTRVCLKHCPPLQQPGSGGHSCFQECARSCSVRECDAPTTAERAPESTARSALTRSAAQSEW
jgi:hypothetical protein